MACGFGNVRVEEDPRGTEKGTEYAAEYVDYAVHCEGGDYEG
jgi:hypothetical protein